MCVCVCECYHSEVDYTDGVAALYKKGYGIRLQGK